jgi:phosphoglycerate dehydrogenase-like enzyme
MIAGSRGIVVVTYPGFDPDDVETSGALREAGFEVRFAPRTSDRSPADVASIMADATAGVVSTDPFDASVLAACSRLRVLGRVGVGLDTIDLAAATAAGIAVTTTPGANATTVAEHAIGLMLAVLRRFVENDASVKAGGWERGGALTGSDLGGCCVGIVGLGSIGREVARRLRAFDVELLGCDVAATSVEGVEAAGLDELLQRADIVTLHIPLSSSSSALIGARELALMRPGAILVNVARGGIVSEQPLYDALRAGRLRGAGIDVFADEPPVASPLLSLPNVVLTPHVAGISVRSQQRMLGLAVRSVLDVLDGVRPAGLVNPEALDRVAPPIGR